jgi:hypothetical protein
MGLPRGFPPAVARRPAPLSNADDESNNLQSGLERNALDAAISSDLVGHIIAILPNHVNQIFKKCQWQ